MNILENEIGKSEERSIEIIEEAPEKLTSKELSLEELDRQIEKQCSIADPEKKSDKREIIKPISSLKNFVQIEF